MSRLSLITAICLWLVGCHSPPPPTVEPPVAELEVSKSEKFQVGEHLIDASAHVSTEDNCMEAKKPPLADFEEQMLEPATVFAGEQFTHHLVYIVCDPDPEHVIEGTLYRNIYRAGRLLHSEPKPFYLKPGRWAVNALIEVPAKSKPGTYTLRTEFVGKASRKQKIKLIKQSDFEVQG